MSRVSVSHLKIDTFNVSQSFYQHFFDSLFCFSPFQVLAKRLEVVLLPLELRGGVDLAGAHLGNSHLHVVHPLDHLGVSVYSTGILVSSKIINLLPGVIDLLDEGIVFLPECHF